MRATENGHTPGGWLATERSGYHEILAPSATSDWYGREKMHAVAYCDTEIDESEQLANARLIAAAPCLLKALEQIAHLRPLGDVDTCKAPRKLVEQMERIALAAIAKATGAA